VLSKVACKERIPFGHKIAIAAMQRGDDVFKYGETIGRASSGIEPGDYVHLHNLESKRMQLPEIWYRK
jgi:altronate dehydratase small subunit